jgi:hypothetical protein
MSKPHTEQGFKAFDFQQCTALESTLNEACLMARLVVHWVREGLSGDLAEPPPIGGEAIHLLAFAIGEVEEKIRRAKDIFDDEDRPA